MRHYTADVVLKDDLLKRTVKKNFEEKRWLEGDPDRHVYLSDIWHRLRSMRDDFGNLKNAIIALVKHDKAVVVARGLMSAFMVLQFIGFYAESAVADVQPMEAHRLVRYFKLANGNILSIAEFARIYGDWNFLDECVLLANYW